MGVDFIIDNDPRYDAKGTITDWRGETTYDREIDSDELRGLFEDPPEGADIHIRSVPLNPALPDDIAKLRAGMPYSAFTRLRAKLAATIGLDLDYMWGFMPMGIRIAELRGLPQTAAARAPDYEAWEKEQQDWWRERARQWDTVDNGMVDLIHHSDCDGDLSPDQCRTVAPALAEAIGRMDADHDRENAEALLRMIEACAAYNRRLLFR